MSTFEEKYPMIAWWFDFDGLIELGYDSGGYLHSQIRVLDPGGMLWEGKEEYDSIEDALNDAEEFLAGWKKEEFPDE